MQRQMARGETNGDKSQHTARRCVALSDIWRRQRTSEETSAWKKKKLVAREVQAAFAAFNMKQIKQATAKAFWGMKPRDSSSVEYRAGSQRILLGAQICVDVRARTFELCALHLVRRADFSNRFDPRKVSQRLDLPLSETTQASRLKTYAYATYAHAFSFSYPRSVLPYLRSRCDLSRSSGAEGNYNFALLCFHFFETKCFSTVCTVLCVRWGGQSPIHAVYSTSVKAGQPVWSCTI